MYQQHTLIFTETSNWMKNENVNMYAIISVQIHHDQEMCGFVGFSDLPVN